MCDEVMRSMSSEEFETEFGLLYRSVFSADPFDVRPFCSAEWQIFLVPYGNNMEERDFCGLLEGAKACSDRDIVIKDDETVEPQEAAVVIQASYEAFETAKFRPGTNMAIMDTRLFGRSGRWGCICVASLDDVAIVGGDTTFSDTFAVALGGVPLLRDRFLKFSTAEWSMGTDMRSQLLRVAGW